MDGGDDVAGVRILGRGGHSLGSVFLASLTLLLALLAFAAPVALADNTINGYMIHWMGTGSQIAVCPAGDTLHWKDIPGKEYAAGVPAQAVTCYLPSGQRDPTASAPWEGQGTPKPPNNRLFPPVSAIGQAPWIATLANLGQINGMPSPMGMVSSAINHWILSSATHMDSGLAGFYGTMTNMPLLVNVPLVRWGFALSFVLSMLVALGKLAVDMHRWSRGDPEADRPDWRPWALLGGVMFLGPLAMDGASLATNQVISGLWRTVLHTPAAPSGLRLMQMVAGGSGTNLFASGGLLGLLGGILFALLAAVLLFVLGMLLEAAVLLWLCVGAFAPLLALWGTWGGGIDSPQLRRIGTAVGRTFAFHAALAVFWLFLYAALSGVDQALGLGGRYTVLLLVFLAIVAVVFYWLVPVLRVLVAEPDEWDRWAAGAERLLVRLGLGTGNQRLTALGTGLGEQATRLSNAVRSARALPDRVTSGLPHVRGDALLSQYEHMAAHPGALARWTERTEPDGQRYLVLGGHSGAVDLVRREFVGNVPLTTVDLGGAVAVPWPAREKAQKALAEALDGVVVYWDSPMGPVTLRQGRLVRIGAVPPRSVCMGPWGE